MTAKVLKETWEVDNEEEGYAAVLAAALLKAVSRGDITKEGAFRLLDDAQEMGRQLDDTGKVDTKFTLTAENFK